VHPRTPGRPCSGPVQVLAVTEAGICGTGGIAPETDPVRSSPAEPSVTWRWVTPIGLRWLVAREVHYAPVMAEPLTVAGTLAATAAHIYYHLVGGAVHHRFEQFLERWREAAIDQPPNAPRIP
jgi:hypothetical protein